MATPVSAPVEIPRPFDVAAARKWARAYRRNLAGWLPMDRTAPILQLACGSGRMLYTLKKMGFTNLRGVHAGEPPPALARQVLPDVVAADHSAYLDEHPDRFRLIVGLDLVEYVAKEALGDLLERVRGALVPGGRVILRMPNAEAFRGTASARAAARGADRRNGCAVAPTDLERLARDHGFEQPESRETPPVGTGATGTTSFVRAALWQGLRGCALGRNLVARGRRGAGVFTSDFLMSARVGPEGTVAA